MMRTPEPWQPPGGNRSALVAGLLVALVIVVGVVWFIATYSEAEQPTSPSGEVPEAVRPPE